MMFSWVFGAYITCRIVHLEVFCPPAPLVFFIVCRKTKEVSLHKAPKRGYIAQPIYFYTGLSSVFLRLTFVMPRASEFFPSSVTWMVKKHWKPVKSHPTVVRVTSAVLISHKAGEEAWHTKCHNIQTHTAIHPPVFLDNSHFCSVCVHLQPICPRTPTFFFFSPQVASVYSIK